MLVYTLVFNIVQGNFVAPIVYGRAVNIHPAIVLLAIPAGMALAGIAGMFLVVPVIGVIATTWRMALRVFADGPVDRRRPDVRTVGRRPDRRRRAPAPTALDHGSDDRLTPGRGLDPGNRRSRADRGRRGIGSPVRLAPVEPGPPDQEAMQLRLEVLELGVGDRARRP